MKNNKKAKLLLVLFCATLLTGCTKTLTDKNNKVVKSEETGRTLTENVLCKPEDEKILELYRENGKKDIDKLPSCKNFQPFSHYEGMWTTLFVKPLAWVIINIGLLLEKTGMTAGIASGIAIILSCLLIRLVLYPLTKKTAMQSEKMKEIQPQLEKLQKKYANKTSQEDQIKQSQEMLMLYQKYKINPVSSCILSFVQIPLLFAYLEAINRTPVIFENTFLGLDMGLTVMNGIMSKSWYAYVIFLIIILGTSYFSFRKTLKDQTAMVQEMKGMFYFMLAMIVVGSFSLPVALGIYWISSSAFTIIQNEIVERKKDKK